MTSAHDAGEVVIPALLRAARGAYALAIRDRLMAAGFEDVPRHGAFVVGGMANHGAPVAGLVRELGISRQAAAQLVDTLVDRGYLERRGGSDDGEQMAIEVTDRGRHAATAVRAGVEAIDAELSRMLSPADLAGLRAGLVALTEIRERMEAERAEKGS
jgi:DNA-binding MarR family transcriptional regulator